MCHGLYCLRFTVYVLHLTFLYVLWALARLRPPRVSKRARSCLLRQ